MSHERIFGTDRRNWVKTYGYCTGDRAKIAYQTRKDARKMARKIPALTGCQAYLCGLCGWYHLGHLPPVVKSGEADRAKLRRDAARKAKRFAERQERQEALRWARDLPGD